MLSFIFALLTFLGAFMQGPAMDSDPAPAPAVVVEDEGTTTSEGEVETFEVPVQDCTPWLVPETDEGYARSQELQVAGWAGDPTDGMEALYPPGC